MVAADTYELCVVALAPDATWTLVKTEVAAADAAAGVTLTTTGGDGLLRTMIKSPLSREVTWTLHFAPGKAQD